MKNENKRDLILEWMFQKYITGADIESACEGLIKKSNPERKRILENFLRLLRDPYSQQKIEELQKIEQPSNNSEFLQLLLVTFAERIFGHDKRKYDFSDIFTGKRIKEKTESDGTVRKDVSFEETTKMETKPDSNEEFNEETKKNPYQLSLGDGDFIIFNNIGKLTFNTVSSEESKTINKFEITFKASNGNQRTDTVFTNINLKKLSDEKYLRAVLEELLSQKNIEQSNCCGYIGEIVSSSAFLDDLKIGEQANFSELYSGSISKHGSRYKLSQNYELIYDFDTLEAVIEHVRELEKLEQTKRKEKEHYSNWFLDV